MKKHKNAYDIIKYSNRYKIKLTGSSIILATSDKDNESFQLEFKRKHSNKVVLEELFFTKIRGKVSQLNFSVGKNALLALREILNDMLEDETTTLVEYTYTLKPKK